MSGSLTLLASFFPPDLSPAYLRALVGPMRDTLGLAFGAMTLAFLFSLPLALAIHIKAPGARLIGAALSVFRAIPDLTLAIFCVILFGIGPGAGLIALILYYSAAVTKVWADLLATAAPRPVDALRSTGASPLQLACLATLPLTSSDMFGYGAFAFECALRSSIIVGAVGGGGIGTELVGSINGFDFHRASTQILLLVLAIIVLDRAAILLRDRPQALLVLLPFGLASAWIWSPGILALRHALDVFAGMFPPRLPAEAIANLPRLIVETFLVALSATLIAAAAALPAACASASTLSPWWLRFPIRRLCELMRTIPEVVWALVLVAVAGVGPAAGVWALGLHSFGSFARLFADALDSAPRQPQAAIAGTGASSMSVALYSTLPLARGTILTHVLFRFEWNLRMAAVLGMIGAGGIGQALFDAQQLFFYDQVLAYVLVTALMILATDRILAALRERVGCGPKERPLREVSPAFAF